MFRHGRLVGLAGGLGFAQGLANLAFGVIGGSELHPDDSAAAALGVLLMLLQGVAMLVFAVATYRGRLWGLAGLSVVAVIYVATSLLTTGSVGWVIPPLIYLGALLSFHRKELLARDAELSCPECSSPYRLSDYRPDAAEICCSSCKAKLPIARRTPQPNPKPSATAVSGRRLRLTGWQRLWVVVSGTYLVVVGIMTGLLWPTPNTTWHSAEFIGRMPADLRSKVDFAYPRKPSNKGLFVGSYRVEFPNGAVLDIQAAKDGDTTADERVARAYWAVVEDEARSAQWRAVGLALAIWVVPCVAVYAAGWAVAWVRRGFLPYRYEQRPQ